MAVYLDKTIAEFNPIACSPGDKNVLCGLETNILRVASDFF